MFIYFPEFHEPLAIRPVKSLEGSTLQYRIERYREEKVSLYIFIKLNLNFQLPGSYFDFFTTPRYILEKKLIRPVFFIFKLFSN